MSELLDSFVGARICSMLVRPVERAVPSVAADLLVGFEILRRLWNTRCL